VHRLETTIRDAARSFTARTAETPQTVGSFADEGIASLAWQEQVRMLEAQSRRFEAIRTRASTVVAIAGIGASFIASRQGSTTDVAVIAGAAAIALFAVALALAIYVMAPQDMKFGGGAGTILSNWYGQPKYQLHEVYAAMARYCEGWFDENRLKEERLLGRFQASAMFLVAGLAALLVSMLVSL
jgi:hypothetical protein